MPDSIGLPRDFLIFLLTMAKGTRKTKAIRRQYRNPPIEEAVCELRFVPNPEQDFVAAAHFYEKIRKDYPAKPELQAIPPSELTLEGKPASLHLALRGQGGKVLFPDATRTRLIGLASNLLTVHVLRPYPGWEQFRPRIEQAFRTFTETLNPKGLTRIGFRYINKIEVGEEEDTPLAELVTVGPWRPMTLSMEKASLFMHVEATYPDRPATLGANLASIEPSKPGRMALLLDLEVAQEWQVEHPLSLSETMDTIDDFRNREREAFEAYVSDEARRIFDAE